MSDTTFTFGLREYQHRIYLINNTCHKKYLCRQRGIIIFKMKRTCYISPLRLLLLAKTIPTLPKKMDHNILCASHVNTYISQAADSFGSPNTSTTLVSEIKYNIVANSNHHHNNFHCLAIVRNI